MASLQSARGAIHNATQKFSNIQIFNIDSALCNDDICKAISNSQILYYDKTHLNPIGVALVRSRINFEDVLSKIIAE